ncbi:MAG TPA: glycosyltransferase family 39 protein, partial [Pyrinomonadaceae bacterium]
MNRIIGRADLLPLLLVTLLATLACFLFLNRGPLYYDEAIYAQVAKEITQTGDWITLHWNGRPWFHKPPLYLWSTALLFRVFGPSELLARFTSALAGVGCVALTYLIAKRVANNTTAIVAALILLSSALFTVNARQGMTDVLMTLFTLLAVYAYLSTGPERVRWIVTGLACALAVLTKGAAGLLAPMIVVVSLVWDRRWRELTSPSFWQGLIVFLVLAGSWHFLLFAMHGRSFLSAYLFKHVIERASADLHQYRYGYEFYFEALSHFVWPWVLLMPFAVAAAVRRRGSKIVFVNAVLPLLLFTLAQTKFSWYIVPIVPALAILTAQFLCAMMMRVRERYRPLIWLTVLLFAIVGSVEVL